MHRLFSSNWIFLSIIVLQMLLASSCTAWKKGKKGQEITWAEQIEGSPGFSKSFTGFSLIEAQSGKVLHEYDANKYFTPASNAKILTLYTCLHILGDSLPALRYEVRGDSLLFWGTGDPSLLNPKLDNNQRVLDFLRSRPEQLFFCPDNFEDASFGAGWAWDDYNYSFQAEKSGMPLYGNVVSFEKEKNSLEYEVYPQLFRNTLVDAPEQQIRGAKIKRDKDANRFYYNAVESIAYKHQAKVPFKYSHKLLVLMLEDLLQRNIQFYPHPLRPGAQSKTLYSSSPEAAYRQIMQESDNFIAEQLLLLCANQVFDTLNTNKIIKYAQEEFLNALPDRPIWVDGSGLSRYNLITPRSLTALLQKIYQLTGWEYLKSIFPAGGKSGSIKNWYGGGEKPYVFAKTGTLSNKHCLSGYLKAKSGKLLIFSFMHNNYTSGSQPLMEEMEKVLKSIYLQY